jgi:hypothetical protein
MGIGFLQVRTQCADGFVDGRRLRARVNLHISVHARLGVRIPQGVAQRRLLVAEKLFGNI